MQKMKTIRPIDSKQRILLRTDERTQGQGDSDNPPKFSIENGQGANILNILPFLASQWGINSRTRSPENRDHLYTDIKRPAKYYDFLFVSF